MSVGHCRLCDQKRELVCGHVWPKFAYKRFISSPGKGGSFIDVQEMKVSNRQVTRDWFCKHCDGIELGVAESDMGRFCGELNKRPEQIHRYPATFLRFLTSVSWRVSMYHMEGATSQQARDLLKAPNKRWKQFLKGERGDIRPYSQHVFICFDPELGLDRGLGGEVYPTKKLVFSQVGPLFIVGLLHRNQLSRKDIDVWSHSEITSEAGNIKPIESWNEGKEITKAFADVLRKHESTIKVRILESRR